jgi:hypothetical protein
MMEVTTRHIIKVFDSRSGPAGSKDVTVRVPPGCKLLLVADDGHYRLGEPMEDMILAGYIITGGAKVSWDSVEQKWMDI